MAPKDTAVTCNSLICLLQALEGKITTVELRNETSATGKIESVDSYMNVTMSDAIFSSPREHVQLTNFFIHGRQIRFVRIPDDVDVSKAIESRLKQLTKSRNHDGQQRKKVLTAQKRRSMNKWMKEEASLQGTATVPSATTTAPSTTATGSLEPGNTL